VKLPRSPTAATWPARPLAHLTALLLLPLLNAVAAPALRVLNFQADNGFAHDSKAAALALVEDLGKKNAWAVVTTAEAASLTTLDLTRFDVVVFNNNCGNKGPIMSVAQQSALQKFVRGGGGFLGIHCAGAIWKEGGEFQAWYEGLIGTKMVDHPAVQEAKLLVEDRTHLATRHLPESWIVKDEWHRFASNPRPNVRVLLSLDENSYPGKEKMGGDHPAVWSHHYDGGRAFFSTLGHTKEIYADPNYRSLIEGAILWAGPAKTPESVLPVRTGLFLDLDADRGVEVEDGARVKAWRNQISGNAADVFVKRDEGRKVPGSGRPTLRSPDSALGGHRTLVFRAQELINLNEDAFDHCIQGSGYTWFSVMCAYEQIKGKPEVNSFFGNLKNSSNYEGFWGNLADDNRVWLGSRAWPATVQGKQPLWNEKNPQVISPSPLLVKQYYVVAGRMGAGTGVVNLDLYVNSAQAVDTKPVPVNPAANPSKMAIGQERDAINHPGVESFDGEIARFLIFDRALTDAELADMLRHLLVGYKIQE
jgi:type 1 glutamine amidotransferase